MKCIKDQCRSPTACGGFGYCRELNFMTDNDSNERHMIRHLYAEKRKLDEFLKHDQWSIIDRAIERYSSGEISDLHALGLVSSGFLKLNEARAALASGE